MDTLDITNCYFYIDLLISCYKENDTASLEEIKNNHHFFDKLKHIHHIPEMYFVDEKNLGFVPTEMTWEKKDEYFRIYEEVFG